MNFEDMQSSTDNSHSTPIGHPATSIVLYVLSWLFFLLDSFTADQIWTWVWRGLSLVSLALIIYINWSKAREIFLRDKKSKHDE